MARGRKVIAFASSKIDRSRHFDDYRNMELPSTFEHSIDNIAGAFAALGQPSRLRIVRLLLSAHPQGLPAGEIQKDLGISAPTLSHHLDKLRQVGIVEATKDRQWIWYSVRSQALKSLIDFLFEECCTRNQVVALPHDASTDSDRSTAETDCCD
jgi:DNA-binding transcriptional ArsR family regulator